MYGKNSNIISIQEAYTQIYLSEGFLDILKNLFRGKEDVLQARAERILQQHPIVQRDTAIRRAAQEFDQNPNVENLQNLGFKVLKIMSTDYENRGLRQATNEGIGDWADGFTKVLSSAGLSTLVAAVLKVMGVATNPAVAAALLVGYIFYHYLMTPKKSI